MMEELKKKGFCVRRYYTKEEIVTICKEKDIYLTYKELKIIEGWVNCPKGLLQALFDRGYIDANRLDKYSVDRKKTSNGCK